MKRCSVELEREDLGIAVVVMLPFGRARGRMERSMLVAVEGLGKKMQEGGLGKKKNSKKRPCSEVITSSDGLSVSGTTSANSSTPHRTETSTKHKQVLTKQAQVTSPVHHGGPGGRRRRHLARLPTQVPGGRQALLGTMLDS